MARPYTQKFLMELGSRQDDSLGTRLARACIHSNLSSTHIAVALGVTRATIHNWFHGMKIARSRRPIVEAFLKLVLEDTQKGDLPVTNAKQSKHYIEMMLGREI